MILKSKKLILIMGVVLSFSAFAESGNAPIELGYNQDGVISDQLTILPVAFIVNENKPIEAWLDVSHGFKFFFSTRSQTIEDVATALKTLHPLRSLRFSCDASRLVFCEKYLFFNFSYDYDTGKFIVIYQIKDAQHEEVPSEPAIVVQQYVSLSESAGMGTIYRRGNWNGDLGAGITQHSRLLSGLQYDVQTNKMEISNLRYEYDETDSAQIAFYQSNVTPSTMTNFGVDQVRGLELSLSGSGGQSDNGYYEPIILDSAVSSIVNIYDDNNKLVRSLQASQGLNRIDVPNSLASSKVKIEEVVDGQVLKSYEQTLNRFGSLGSMSQLNAGIAKFESEAYDKDNIDSPKAPKTEQFFATYEKSLETIKGTLTAFPALNWYGTKFDYNGIKGLSTGMDSTFQKSYKKHDLRAGYTFELGGIDYYASTSRSLGQDKLSTHSLNVVKKFTDRSRIEFQYTQSTSLRSYRRKVYGQAYDKERTASSPYFIKKSVVDSEYKRLGLKFTSSFDSKVGRFDYNIYGSTDLHNDNRVGLSVTFVPELKSRWLNPSVGVELDKSATSTIIQNQMAVTDNLVVTPQVNFANGNVTQYGSMFSYAGDLLNASGSLYRQQPDGHNLYLNGNSSLFFSRYGLASHGSQKTVGYIFTNNASIKGRAESVEFNINGVTKRLGDGEIFYSDGMRGKENIYSELDGVALNPMYSSIYTKPYRLYHVDYKHDTDKILVSGRVLNGNTPVSGIAVVNHAGKTISDAQGYFNLTVSRSNPVISIYNQGRECHKQIPNVLKNFKKESNQVYLGRLQCLI
jgi:hypothetical protein